MAYKIFPIPNFEGDAVDLFFCNTSDPNSNGVVHYAYTVAAEDHAIPRRMFPWAKVRDFQGEFGKRHPTTIKRLKEGRAYRPGEGVLESEDGSTFSTDHDTIMRLGALELLANISSGRLSTNDKDPFPHQLALQQFVRKTPKHEGLRRYLIADEVGLGKTIEVGLILRDILLSRGQVDGFRCLYLTSGGLVDDAAEKLRNVLSGTIDGTHIVDTVSSFRQYGKGNINGVYVASMHAARLYATESQKKHLPSIVHPQIIIIDECHHAASDGDLAGVEIHRQVVTQTYMAAKQLLSGCFWAGSEPPELGILMSATPFRSRSQFVNLLRLLTDGVDQSDGQKFDAFGANVHGGDLRAILREGSPASVVWRRQSDEGVRSWSGNRIFPNLTIQRPHQILEDQIETPFLPRPSKHFLELLSSVKESVKIIARSHSQSFGGFAIAQLEKKLTSSSIAGACWLFSWAVRHCQWSTQEEYRNDSEPGTEGLRKLIRKISQRIAKYSSQSNTGHATVRFPSDGFEFAATSLAQPGVLTDIHKYSRIMREEVLEASNWIANQEEISRLVDLAEQLLDLGMKGEIEGGAEDAKLAWLTELLRKHPNDRFLLFTESLQTCEILQGALGSTCRVLVGSMSKAARNQAVADLQNPRMNARILVATSAADEGFDLQIASKVIHWDLSSSPATLMQRNGRVARLGQVTDVVAYYLILTGTHEERRDGTLQVKFAELGIDDEALKNRILGSLTEEEETRLEQAIEDNEEAVVGDILKKAANDNEKMDEQLAQIRTTLDHAQVLSRDDLAIRLGVWQSMGFSDDAMYGIKFQFDSVAWNRPVFGDVTRMEQTNSKIARIENNQIKQEMVFDPEFLIFGPKDSGSRLRLAGMPPWINSTNRHDRPCIIPYNESDLLGKLFQGIARADEADFLSIPRDSLNNEVKFLENAKWLLFCTHPLREAENIAQPKPRPFLTYYSFSELIDEIEPVPLNGDGADAAEVHKFICCLEQHAIKGAFNGTTDISQITAARNAGMRFLIWIESVSRFGAESFLDEEKYFVPIPVALIRIVD
ncbi:MAG TPA: DEAD/DEAH box helicase [Tepidisphaeraceae bacterium]|jgi:superfamily II DNA or RNA helicase|nr:DEAD/DEAH box helicase [Tepidisphaeraceae bacterium]